MIQRYTISRRLISNGVQREARVSQEQMEHAAATGLTAPVSSGRKTQFPATEHLSSFKGLMCSPH